MSYLKSTFVAINLPVVQLAFAVVAGDILSCHDHEPFVTHLLQFSSLFVKVQKRLQLANQKGHSSGADVVKYVLNGRINRLIAIRCKVSAQLHEQIALLIMTD